MKHGSAQRELAYYEHLYAGFAQEHFAKPAVRAFREHLVRRIVKQAGLSQGSRVLSLGCGIGDTELLLARRVGHVTGVDLSPAAIRQARADAAAAGITNTEFAETDGTQLPEGPFDAVVGIFFLHHLPDPGLQEFPARLTQSLRPGGVFYGLDPSVSRLSGKIGQLLFPRLMAKYQTADERELAAGQTAALFRNAGWECRVSWYDFVSTPLAGLLPSWRGGYRVARLLDEALVRVPGLRGWSSNFELIAKRIR